MDAKEATDASPRRIFRRTKFKPIFKALGLESLDSEPPDVSAIRFSSKSKGHFDKLAQAVLKRDD
jgi:hypothetical protein